MRAARIENGLVADLWEVPSLDCFDGIALVTAPPWVSIGTAYEHGVGFTGDILPVPSRISNFDTRYTFEVGCKLVVADGGRHRTVVEAGVYRVLRDGAETIVGAGAVIYFTATERHSIEALSPGSIVNTVIPGAVSRFQARAALYQAGYLETVESIMAMPETPMLAKLAWQDAQEFRRDSTTVATMASALSLTGDQVDDLFVAASQIVA